MADAIEALAEAVYGGKFEIKGDFVDEFHKMVHEMVNAAVNWRTHGGKEI